MTTQHTHPEHGDVDARDVAEQHAPELQNTQDAQNIPGTQDEPTSTSASSLPQSTDAEQQGQSLTLPTLLSFNITLVSPTAPTSNEQGTQLPGVQEPQNTATDTVASDASADETFVDAAPMASIETVEASVQVDMLTSTLQDEATDAFDTSDTVNTGDVHVLASDEVTPLEPAPLALSHDEVEETPVQPSASTNDTEDATATTEHPFTEFFEQFRQSEARGLADTPDAFTEFARSTQGTESDTTTQGSEEVLPPFDFGEGSSFIPAEDDATSSAVVNAIGETEQSSMEAAVSEENQRVAAVESEESGEQVEQETPTRPERPVSPLLRPANRHRPRHGAARHREEFVRAHGNETPTAETAPAVEPTASTPPVENEAQAAQEAPDTTTSEAPKPARRYRFDRPAQQGAQRSYGTYATPSRTTSNGDATSSSVRESAANTSSAASSPVTAPVETATADTPTSAAIPTPTTSPQEEQDLKREAATVEQSVTSDATSAASNTSTPVEHGRRKHGQERQQERQREKEQQTQADATAQEPPESVADIAALVAETHEALQETASDVAPEDLPPLEYADLQKANSRRRRRHRNGQPVSNGTASKAQEKETPVQQAETSVSPAASQGTPVMPAESQGTGTQYQNGQSSQDAPYTSPVAAKQTPFIPASTPTTPYTLTSGYTLTQMNQGNDAKGPFMGPEPSPARGSNFGRESRSGRAEQVRPTTYSTRDRERENGASGPSAASMNHFANVVAQAIQTQSDRMVAELRRVNQSPTNVSVSLPPFPSTERVGVFVDVANLLYSARTNRIAIDFGKLLDFLRGNRRLVRAQAYCPTSPQPGDEQMFLQAVKGLGYRITTKNYKTFASGAKKADLDLDLCMDVVRLVDGRAVDCIVLVSGDSDFMPMLDYCSDHGVRVEIAAFDEAMSATLRQSCDMFINLSMLEEIRA